MKNGMEEKEFRISKKELLNKLESLTREIIRNRPGWDTVFRIYFDSLVSANKILYAIRENPWHPDNDHANEIFETIKEELEKLEEFKQIAQKQD